jgi:E3 ubiquitin-protein ligase HUWE1
MRTLVDFATNETLVYLSKIVYDSLRDTKDFWKSLEPSSKLLPLLDIDGVYRVLV